MSCACLCSPAARSPCRRAQTGAEVQSRAGLRPPRGMRGVLGGAGVSRPHHRPCAPRQSPPHPALTCYARVSCSPVAAATAEPSRRVRPSASRYARAPLRPGPGHPGGVQPEAALSAALALSSGLVESEDSGWARRGSTDLQTAPARDPLLPRGTQVHRDPRDKGTAALLFFL